LWSIERSDAEACKINIDHMNKNQVVKARFLLDAKPDGMPIFKCPMKDLHVSKYKPLELNKFVAAFIKIAEPQLMAQLSRK
jgi:hypothetical protein